MRYCLCLSYDGSAFCGWQIQPNAPSVQASLEAVLSRLLGSPVAVTGAGRTDTGVHAANYIAHFDCEGILPFEASDFTYKINAMLPREVVVHSVTPVASGFHARFSARRREYTYFIHRCKDPFLRATSWQCGYPQLDFEAMNQACRYLLGTHDFSCFEKTGGDNKTSLCTVYEASWRPYTPSHIQLLNTEEGTVLQIHGHPRPIEGGSAPLLSPRGSRPSMSLDDVQGHGLRRRSAERESSAHRTVPSAGSDYWYFRIAADRFLRNMVRATVGTLIEVGRGKHAPEWVAELIESGTRSDAGESVPGHALFLNKVEY